MKEEKKNRKKSKNSQGMDPRTLKRNSPGEAASTFSFWDQGDTKHVRCIRQDIPEKIFGREKREKARKKEQRMKNRKNGWTVERENGKMFFRPWYEEFRRSERGFGKCSEQRKRTWKCLNVKVKRWKAVGCRCMIKEMSNKKRRNAEAGCRRNRMV